MAINKAVRKDDGRVMNVPRKLEAGMAVVVWFKNDFPLMTWEMRAGIIAKKWLKTSLEKVTSDGWFSVVINNERIAFNKDDAIIVRSVSLEDTKTPAQVARTMRTNAAKQRRRLEGKAQ